MPDTIDLIVDKLNEIDGIEFTRDAWEDKAPDSYGVVELNGEAGQLWADGHLIDSIWSITVTLYVAGDSDAWPEKVREKLEELEADGTIDLSYAASRAYDYGIDKVRWSWNATLLADLTRE